MQEAKLILLEGLPGSGKSTNSRLLWSQLERSGKRARWVHEEARPHPTLYFFEACLTHEEYARFLAKHPQAKAALEQVKVVRPATVGIDLLEVKRNRLQEVGEAAFRELEFYDVWNFSVERYKEVALEKWAHFVQTVLEGPDQAVLLDSSMFQYQVYTFLLENESYEHLADFVSRLFEIVKPLNPMLIYLYRRDPRDSIAHVEKMRGTGFFENIYDRDKDKPYYQGRPKHADSFREFLLDYAAWAMKLFEAAPCRKRALDLTSEAWERVEQDMLGFAGLERLPDPAAQAYCGAYRNEELDVTLEVRGTEFADPWGRRKQLIPRAEQEYYLADLPVVLRFETPERLVIAGDQICHRWTNAGTVYTKIEG